MQDRRTTSSDGPPWMQASNITFASGAGVLIHGWLVPGKPKQGVVLLLHAVRGDRRDMISRAEFLRTKGYAVLLIDFQSHGENRGRRITYGYLESMTSRRHSVPASTSCPVRKLPSSACRWGQMRSSWPMAARR